MEQNSDELLHRSLFMLICKTVGDPQLFYQKYIAMKIRLFKA